MVHHDFVELRGAILQVFPKISAGFLYEAREKGRTSSSGCLFHRYKNQKAVLKKRKKSATIIVHETEKSTEKENATEAIETDEFSLTLLMSVSSRDMPTDDKIKVALKNTFAYRRKKITELENIKKDKYEYLSSLNQLFLPVFFINSTFVSNLLTFNPFFHLSIFSLDFFQTSNQLL